MVLGNRVLLRLGTRAFKESLRGPLKAGRRRAVSGALITNPLLRLYRWLTRETHSPIERPHAVQNVRAFAPIQEARIWEVHLLGLPIVPVPHVAGRRVSDALSGHGPGIIQVGAPAERVWDGRDAIVVRDDSAVEH